MYNVYELTSMNIKTITRQSWISWWAEILINTVSTRSFTSAKKLLNFLTSFNKDNFSSTNRFCYKATYIKRKMNLLL